MRIILRILAVIIWVATALMALVAWMLWGLGHFGLVMAGFPRVIKTLEVVLTLALGPVAAIQLWRLQESGRRMSLFLSLFAITDLTVSWFLSAKVGDASGVLVGITGSAIFSALLLSPQARRVCQKSDTTIQIQT